jgi:phenylacetate-CoA ligase
MQSYRAGILVTTPTQAFKLATAIELRGIDPQSLQVRTVLLSRPLPPDEREILRRALFADIRCGFGVSEVLDPGLCTECAKGRLHVNEDQFLAECENGELLVTTLAREAMPLLRYRTRIACKIDREKCLCGRTGAVITPGERLDGRFRVNEMPLYHNQIVAVLEQTRAAGHPFLLNISEDRVDISVKVTGELFADTVSRMENLRVEIESEFLNRLGIRANVSFLGPKAFEDRQMAAP